MQSGGQGCGVVAWRGLWRYGESRGVRARAWDAVSITRQITVEGTYVQDIILDTGCARTLAREHLVPPAKKDCRGGNYSEMHPW